MRVGIFLFAPVGIDTAGVGIGGQEDFRSAGSRGISPQPDSFGAASFGMGVWLSDSV
jgi:hypothetical protein